MAHNVGTSPEFVAEYRRHREIEMKSGLRVIRRAGNQETPPQDEESLPRDRNANSKSPYDAANDPDAALVAQARHGDLPALTEILASYQRLTVKASRNFMICLSG